MSEQLKRWLVTIDAVEPSGTVRAQLATMETEARKPYDAERKALDLGLMPEEGSYRVTVLERP